LSSLVLAHGGAAGAIAEAFVGIAVVGVLVAVWLRERSARREEARSGLSEPEDREG
jgi:hypothetical protein